jgi:hypothetical protein
MRFTTIFRLLLTALWLGAAIFFSLAVAPAAFGVLREAQMANADGLAGNIVNKTLAMVNYSGLVIGAILILTSFAGTKSLSRIGVWTERILLILMTAACAVGQFVIGAWMGILRLQMGKPIEEVGADDPLKIQFNILHKYSVWVLLAGMVFALLAFFVISLKSDTNVTVEKKDG